MVDDGQNRGPSPQPYTPLPHSNRINGAPQMEEFQVVIITVDLWLFQW